MMNRLLYSLLQTGLFVFIAPLFIGIVKMFKCWLQNRSAPSVFQCYRDLRKLFHKQTILAHHASWIFRFAPYLIFSITALIASAIPFIVSPSQTVGFTDVILIAGLFGLSRFFLALAALDIGTSFGGMGASREMTVATLAEPALMIAFFSLAMMASSTRLDIITTYLSTHSLWFNPSMLFVALAFAMIAVAETGRIPVDNPATHLELTMIHEAMILEYSGRHLALIEWAAQIKLLIYTILFANLFLPFPLINQLSLSAIGLNGGIVIIKCLVLAWVLVLAETHLAKLRLFRVPLLLNMAFLLCLLGLLIHVIAEVA